jgi:ankyrin repeat protein
VFLDDLEDVQSLLQQGAAPDARDEDGRPVVMLAVMNQNRAITLALLEAGADVDARDPDGWTPLQVAVQRRLHDVASTLIRFGCDVNLADHDGTTALARAVRICRNDEPLLGLLRSHGADPDLADVRGSTAARLARRRGIVLPPCAPAALH